MNKKQRITKQAIEKEIKAAEERLKEIERLTGARLSLNKTKIINDPNRKAALESLQNIDWNKLQEGKKFKKDFVNAVVEGSYWDEKARYLVNFKTEVQKKDVPRLLTAAARASKIKGFTEPIRAANVEASIKYFEKYKSPAGWNRHLNAINRKKADNFAGNLQAMIDYADLDNENIRSLKHLKQIVKKDPNKWTYIIEEYKLYEIAGVNMYSSGDQEVDLKNNADQILETVRDAIKKEYEDDIKKDIEAASKKVYDEIDPIEYAYLKSKNPAKAKEYLEKNIKANLGKYQEAIE